MRLFSLLLLNFILVNIKTTFAIDRFVNAATGTNVGDCSAGNCQTITYTIAQADAGDVIIVAAGIYAETININKSLTLRGAFVGIAGNNAARGTGESIIQNPANDLANGILVRITANNVILDGFTLNGQNNYVQGIAINGFQNISIQNNRITNFNTTNTNPNTQLNAAAIWAEGASTGNIFQHNFIQNVNNPNVTATPTTTNPDNFMLGIGIATGTNFYAQMSNNTIAAATVGIRVRNYTAAGVATTIGNNQIDARLQGLRLSNLGVNASPFTVINNTFDFSAQGYPITVVIFGNQNLELPNSALNFTQLNQAVNVSNNNIDGAFYGYFLFGINPAINFLIYGGNIESVAQGVACVNYDGSSIYAPSRIRLENITMDNFQGQAVGSNNFFINPIKDAYDFHAGVYLLIASGTTNNADTLVANIENCIINGTSRVEKNNGAGIYAANFSTRRLVTLTVNNCEISNHDNRGVHLQLVNSATFTNCDMINNGTGGISAGAFRFNIVLRENTTDVSFTNCRIESPNARFCIDGKPGSQMTVFNCVITGGVAGRVNFDPTQLNQNFSGCWWGSNVPPALQNFIDFNPWLNEGTDIDLATRGFQGDFSYLNVNTAGFQFAPLERLQEAHNLLAEGGTIHLRAANFDETLTISKNCNLTNEGTANISNLTMNGVGIRATLLNPFTISNTLTFNNGIVENSPTSILHLTNNANNALLPATLTGTSWVNGYLRRNLQIGNFYDFPVGTATNMELTQVKLNAQTGITNLLTRFNPNNPLTAPIASNFTPFTENGIEYAFLNTAGYWEIAPNGGGTSTDYDLLMYPTFLTPIQNGAIVKRSGSPDWLVDGTADLIALGIERNGLNGFSNFAIATDDIPLANSLVNLHLQAQNTGLLLRWELPTLQNLQSISLERSTDLINFEKIYQSSLSPNEFRYQFLDVFPLANPNIMHYYRLKMIQNSGQTSYSTLIAGKIDNSTQLIKAVYPNPSKGEFQLLIFDVPSALLEVIDMQGRIHHQQRLDNVATSLDLRNLPSGAYFLRVVAQGKNEWRKIFIE